MVELSPDCPIHLAAVEMVRTSAALDDRFDRQPTADECHTCTVCQLARELAYLRSEQSAGRVSRRRREPPVVWEELKREVLRLQDG